MSDAQIEQLYEAMDGNPMMADFHERHGIESALILTVYEDEMAALIAGSLADRLRDRVVVEIGAGIGLLACHLGQYARRVYAIDADPSWATSFVAAFYMHKPKNVTYIFGAADEAPPISADVALFCTHSGRESLHKAATRFAPEVIDVYAELDPKDAARRDALWKLIRGLKAEAS